MTIIEKENNRKILVISRYFPPHIGGTAGVMYNLLKSVDSCKYCVLMGDETGVDCNPIDKNTKLECEYYISDVPKKILKITKQTYITKIFRLFWIPFTIYKGIKIIKREKCKVILGVYPFRSFFIAAYFIHYFSKLPLYYYLNDIYELYSSSIILSWIEHIMEYFIKERALRSSEKVFVITKPLELYYKEKLNLNTIILEQPIELPQNIDIKENSKYENDETIISYTGSITKYQADSVRRMCNVVNNSKELYLKLEICTISSLKMLESWEIGGENVSIKSVGLNEARRIQAKSHILFIPLSFEINDDQIKTCFPSKIWEYFFTGNPVLINGPKSSYFVNYAKEKNFAFVVDVTNEQALLNTIRLIINDNVKRERIIQNAYNELYRHDDKKVVTKFFDLINIECFR